MKPTGPVRPAGVQGWPVGEGRRAADAGVRTDRFAPLAVGPNGAARGVRSKRAVDFYKSDRGEGTSPRVLQVGSLIFWFHSYDALHEDRASLHVGKGTQDDYNDAKIWLEPSIEVAKAGRSLKRHELRRAISIIEQNQEYLREQWYEYKYESR